jgi:hypothetical protein
MARPAVEQSWKVRMQISKPVMALVLAILTVAVAVGCFAEVF